MTSKTFLKRLKLNKEDFDEIENAVRKAEEGTSGEIALAATAESSSYAFYELLSSLISGFILMISLLPLADQINAWLGRILWGSQSWHLVAFYIASYALLVTFLYLLFNIPFLDSLVVPSGAKKQAVSTRALRYFTESGVYATSEHSGILIYVSFFEREVRIIADQGLSEKVGGDLWNLIADEMKELLAKGKVKEAYLTAIERCAVLLKEKFPSDGNNKNELADGLVILENEKWQ